MIFWLLAASLGAAQEDSSVKHRPKKKESSAEKSQTSHRHQKSKHSSTKHGAEDDSSPTPTPRKRHTEDPNDDSSKEATAETSSSPAPANVASATPENLVEFDKQPPKVQQLIRNALALTEQNLTYRYGSSDPSAGGMDCSGFIYYVLSESGFKDVPRDSSGQYAWIRQTSNFRAVLSRNPESFEFRELRPGDLMFWSGTYRVNREIPISHVMIYLGTEKSTKKAIMVGASDGRSYGGIRRNGVSVFDFKMPSGEPKIGEPDLIARFEGYGAIPGLREQPPASEARNFSETDLPQSKPKPTPKNKDKPLSNGD